MYQPYALTLKELQQMKDDDDVKWIEHKREQERIKMEQLKNRLKRK